ncbi:hypothetical protein, partial [Thiolapillus sp.]
MLSSRRKWPHRESRQCSSCLPVAPCHSCLFHSCPFLCCLDNQACLRPRERFWDIPVPKIDSAFDNLLVPQTSWSPSTTQQLRKLVAAPY